MEPYSVELYREREAEERWNTDKMRWDKDLFDLYQSEEYQEVFREMLYGTATPNIADVAKVQFGAPGGEKYWKDYFGQPGRWEWCAIFVSYCIHNSVLHESVDVNHGSVMQWYDYFLQHKRFVTVSEENNPLPQPGWIIFYNWWKEDENGNMVQDQKLDHVAVVTEVNSTAGKIEIVTVEGNVSDSCLMLVKDFHKLYEIGVVGYGFFDIPEVLDEPAA